MKNITDILDKQNLKKLIRVCLVMSFFVTANFAVAAENSDSKNSVNYRQTVIDKLDKVLNVAPDSHHTADSKDAVAGAKSNVLINTKRWLGSKIIGDGMDWDANKKIGKFEDTQLKIYNSTLVQRYIEVLTIAKCKNDNPNSTTCVKGSDYTSTLGDVASYVSDEIEDYMRKYTNPTDVDNFEKAANSVLDLYYKKAESLADEALKIREEDVTGAKEASAADIVEASKAILENIGDNGCPTVDQLRMKYQSGCWSCLVVEKLVSAFLKAASKAYGLAQKAGLTVLFIGTIMWVLMWGLKNVSSLAQVDPSNILSDLFKMLFRIMLAYFFIMAGLKVVSTYFINPIMGTGAVIAQQFWDTTSINGGTSLHDAVEDYVWDDIDEAEADKAEAEAKAALEKTPLPEAKEETTSTPIEYTEEQLKLLDAAKKEAEDFGETDIPNFMIPGTNTGHLTSPVGCRIPPVVECGKKRKPKADGKCYGSNSHMGLDIGTSGKEGGVVFAMAPGQVVYFYSDTTGNAATITTKDKNGNTWKHRYLHMQDRTLTTFKSLNGTQVAQGQQIGFIGNTGGSSGSHLHIDIKLTGKMGKTTYNSVYVDPLSLSQGKIAPRRYSYNEKTKTFSDNANGCKKGQVDQFPEGFKDRDNVPVSGWPAAGKAIIDLSSTYIIGNQNGGGSGDSSIDYSKYIMEIPDIKYTGPVDIMSKAVMNSILGATKVITNTTAENMVLGNALTCYATLDKGGAWHIESNWGIFRINVGHITNGIMWLQGALIWCTGFLLTLAVTYYLLDICFKIGFAVIALPIVVGLWPFKMTQGKFSTCISIIFKASATFAFLAITTSYSMRMISQALAGPQGGDGLAAIYNAMDTAFNNTGAENDANVQYVSDRMALLSINFVILIFAFLYSYKLIGATIPQYVDKFFPDKAFGGAQPMHHWSTAATKWAKDTAMKPAGLVRDVALHQTGRLAKGAVTGTVGFIGRKVSGKKKDDESKDDKKDNDDKKKES